MKKIDTHGRVEKPSKQVILEAVIWIVLIAFAASTIIVIAEEGMEGAKLTSITEGLWFMYATITTIGYGDAPSELIVKTPDGHQFTLRHSTKIYGGGHGEGAAYPCRTCEPDYVPGVWWNYYDVDLEVVEILSR